MARSAKKFWGSFGAKRPIFDGAELSLYHDHHVYQHHNPPPYPPRVYSILSENRFISVQTMFFTSFRGPSAGWWLEKYATGTKKSGGIALTMVKRRVVAWAPGQGDPSQW